MRVGKYKIKGLRYRYPHYIWGKHIYNLLRVLNVPKLHVYDIPSGDGYLSLSLASCFPNYKFFAIDINEHLIQKAIKYKLKLNLTNFFACVDNIINVRFPKEVFSLWMFINSFFCLKNPASTVSKFLSINYPNFIITIIPNINSPNFNFFSYHYPHINKIRWEIEEVVNFFKKKNYILKIKSLLIKIPFFYLDIFKSRILSFLLEKILIFPIFGYQYYLLFFIKDNNISTENLPNSSRIIVEE